MNYLYIIILIFVIIFLYNDSSQEQFNINKCLNCGFADELECSNCLNCGYCIAPDGSGECIPGNVKGPFFRRDCMIWKHPDQYKYYLPRFYPHRFRSKKI